MKCELSLPTVPSCTPTWYGSTLKGRTATVPRAQQSLRLLLLQYPYQRCSTLKRIVRRPSRVYPVRGRDRARLLLCDIRRKPLNCRSFFVRGRPCNAGSNSESVIGQPPWRGPLCENQDHEAMLLTENTSLWFAAINRRGGSSRTRRATRSKTTPQRRRGAPPGLGIRCLRVPTKGGLLRSKCSDGCRGSARSNSYLASARRCTASGSCRHIPRSRPLCGGS